MAADALKLVRTILCHLILYFYLLLQQHCWQGRCQATGWIDKHHKYNTWSKTGVLSSLYQWLGRLGIYLLGMDLKRTS